MANYIIRNLPEDLHRWLKHEAINQDRTLNELIIKILTEYKAKEVEK